MKPDISVVLPVYNSSQYLKKCVESILNQTHRNIEVIFVDDGSTDNSVEILERYQANDERIKIIKQKRQFAGVARNNGMKAATGKYLIFLDSDDFYKHNMLENLFRVAEKKQAEIVIFGNFYYDNQLSKINNIYIPNMPGKIYSAKSLCPDIFSLCKGWPWNKMFLREFLIKENILFAPLLKYNDTCFVMVAVSSANRIVFINKPFVYYRTNNCHSLQGNKRQGSTCIIQAVIDIKKELEERDLDHGELHEAFIREACAIIKSACIDVILNSDSIYDLKVVFNCCKEKELEKYIDIEEISEKSFVYSLLKSNCLEECLSLLLKCSLVEKRHFVPNTSKAFILGNALISIPKAIRIFYYRLV